MKTILEKTRETLEGLVAKYNKAIVDKSLEAKTEAETAIKSALKDYRKQKLDSVLYRLKQEQNPMMAAVKMLTYPILRTKVIREEGIETRIDLVESNVRVDLVKVAEYCGLSSLWKYKVEKLGLLLAMRAAKELGMPVDELTKMTKDYRMTDLARAEKMGETPSSNTQITKLIQNILDEVLPAAGKANSHDATYMWLASTRAGKEAKTLKVCDGRLAMNLFTDVANRIVTDGVYSVDYKKVEGAAPAVADAPEAEAEVTPVEKSA